MIVNFGLDKIEVLKKKPLSGNIEAKNNVKIMEITEQSVSAIAEKQGALNIKFAFSVLYGKDAASIILEGKILYMLDENEKKQTLELWKKSKKVDPKRSQHILNGILQRCNIKALSLADEVGLPPHIPFPRLALKSQIDATEKKAA